MGAIQVGDVVRPKFGGPNMTVASVLEITLVKCTWFEGAGPKHAAFLASTLEPSQQ
jgi:uncharacterized protein YodC (DUF2158 family)